MKLAFSTNAYTRFPLVDALRGIKRAGFAGVEILADVPHAYPATIDAALAADVRRELDRLGLVVSNVNAIVPSATGRTRRRSRTSSRASSAPTPGTGPTGRG